MGDRGKVSLEAGHLINHEPVRTRVHVIRGARPGPCLFVGAGVHGDELNGVEIVRRFLKMRLLSRLRGTLLAIPVANVPAFLVRSRYLPDRRDLNRLFPGAASGSLGARLARVIDQQVLVHCTHGVDIHTGAVHRPNLPQTRVTAGDTAGLAMAEAFGAPVIVESPERPGTLRSEMARLGKPLVVYEAGEALRLDQSAIRFGITGLVNTLRFLGMLPPDPAKPQRVRKPAFSNHTYWERSPRGGLFTPLVSLGTHVTPETPLGFVADPFGDFEIKIYPREEGVVIGRTNLGIADEGDGVFHIAVTDNPARAAKSFVVTRNELSDVEDEPVEDDPLVD